jgi:hypothetical protein
VSLAKKGRLILVASEEKARRTHKDLLAQWVCAEVRSVGLVGLSSFVGLVGNCAEVRSVGLMGLSS